MLKSTLAFFLLVHLRDFLATAFVLFLGRFCLCAAFVFADIFRGCRCGFVFAYRTVFVLFFVLLFGGGSVLLWEHCGSFCNHFGEVVQKIGGAACFG